MAFALKWRIYHLSFMEESRMLPNFVRRFDLPEVTGMHVVLDLGFLTKAIFGRSCWQKLHVRLRFAKTLNDRLTKGPLLLSSILNHLQIFP